MAEIGILPESLDGVLGAPGVNRTILADLQFASGRLRLHGGFGRLVVGGLDWYGVTDPGRTRVVSIGAVQQPGVSIAAKVDIAMTGVDLAFLREVRRVVMEDHREVEGRRADLYLALFEPGTDAAITDPIPFFMNGRMTAPSFTFDGQTRMVSLSIEGVFSALNFAPGGRWTGADQRRRYPDVEDKFFQYVGGKVITRWPK